MISSKSPEAETVPYETPAKVLFSGLGADEQVRSITAKTQTFLFYQLGGYGRHFVQFKMKGWSGLISEMQSDVNRIATRNLGRDDRIVADHGREVFVSRI